MPTGRAWPGPTWRPRCVRPMASACSSCCCCATISGWASLAHGMTMLEIPAGIFTMGGEQEENKKPHQVTITRPFFMCDREVWMPLFQQFVDDPNYPATEKPQNWKWTEGPAPFVPTGAYPIQ